MALKIHKGMANAKPKILIYSLPGVGKSTLASKFDKPLFLDIEHGLSYIDCDSVSIDRLNSYYKTLDDLIVKTTDENGVITSIKKLPEYNTIVIDSLDWLDALVQANIFGIDAPGLSGKERTEALKMTLNRANGGYGNGKGELENKIRNDLLPRTQLLNKVGYNVVAIAHAKMNTIMDADGNSIEKITPKISDITLNIFMEWFDHILYLKADADGKRRLITSSTDTILAKNRLGLTDDIVVEDGLDLNKLFTPVDNSKAKTDAAV